MNKSKLQVLIQKVISPKHSAVRDLPTNTMTKNQVFHILN